MLSGKKRIKVRQALQQLQDVLEHNRSELTSDCLLALRFHTAIARALLGEGRIPDAIGGAIDEAYGLLTTRLAGDLVAYGNNEVLCGATRGHETKSLARKLDWIETNIDNLPDDVFAAKLAEIDDLGISDPHLMERYMLLKAVCHGVTT